MTGEIAEAPALLQTRRRRSTCAEIRAKRGSPWCTWNRSTLCRDKSCRPRIWLKTLPCTSPYAVSHRPSGPWQMGCNGLAHPGLLGETTRGSFATPVRMPAILGDTECRSGGHCIACTLPMTHQLQVRANPAVLEAFRIVLYLETRGIS